MAVATVYPLVYHCHILGIKGGIYQQVHAAATDSSEADVTRQRN